MSGYAHLSFGTYRDAGPYWLLVLDCTDDDAEAPNKTFKLYKNEAQTIEEPCRHLLQVVVPYNFLEKHSVLRRHCNTALS